jgi:hypothetical protein
MESGFATVKEKIGGHIYAVNKDKSPGSLQSFSCFPLIPGKHKSKMTSSKNKSLLIFGFYRVWQGEEGFEQNLGIF